MNDFQQHLVRATLVTESRGFAAVQLSATGEEPGPGGSGGAFSTYYGLSELKDVEIVVRRISDQLKVMHVVGIPRGKRAPRQFSTDANQNRSPRALVLRGWDLAPPPNPQRISSVGDDHTGALRISLSSASWNRDRKELFEQYVESLRHLVVVDFPFGILTEP